MIALYGVLHYKEGSLIVLGFYNTNSSIDKASNGDLGLLLKGFIAIKMIQKLFGSLKMVRVNICSLGKRFEVEILGLKQVPLSRLNFS